MRRLPPFVIGALAVLALASASPTPAAAASLPSAVPAELVTLLGRMEALNVETERFSLSTSVEFPPHARIPRELRDLLKLFSFHFAGEARVTPEEGSFTLNFLGANFRVVVVRGHTYVFAGARLARRDHGRPWIDTGRAGLAGLFGTHGGTAHPTAESAPSFKHLVELLKSPIAVTPLGTSTLEGQTVSGFRETISAALFKRSQVSSPVFAVARRAAAPETATVETFIAADGLPVRTRILAGEREATAVIELDFPAINFPFAVQAPPPSQTIALAALKRLERRHRRSPRHR